MAVEIEFVGGPADGVRRVIDSDLLNPPKTLPVQQVLIVVGEDSGDGKAIVPETLVYHRAVNPADQGPAWIYRYDGP